MVSVPTGNTIEAVSRRSKKAAKWRKDPTSVSRYIQSDEFMCITMVPHIIVYVSVS